MIVDARVRTACRTQLLTVVIEALLAKENEFYEPDPEKPWFRETLLPGIPARVELMRNGRERTRGVYLVDVFTPANDGTEIADALAGTVVGAFEPGAAFVVEGLTVHIRRSYTRPRVQEPNWYHVPVAIEWWTME